MNLEPLSINEILDKQFFIPDYQRGYRWTPQQVQQLMDDIDSFFPREIEGKSKEKTFYCLQPVVVKQISDKKKQFLNKEKDIELDGEWYEVIDGQQRLTTISLIIQYINDMWVGRQKKDRIKIKYETRGGSEEFLNEISVNDDLETVDIIKSNIDYYYISRAYQTIRTWEVNYKDINKTDLDNAKFQSNFFSYSKIIWYKVDNAEDVNHKLFERLNLGKIPLTNAELTKALFLSSESFSEMTDEEKQVKKFSIALLWDEMEHELNNHDLKFWSFITNKKRDQFETKIDLVLDLIAGKDEDEKDTLFTFLRFTEKQKEGSLLEVWKEIEQFYYTIREWFNDRDYYHKIGYLIASKTFKGYDKVRLGKLVKDSMIKTKGSFMTQIDDLIRDSIRSEISELRYKSHYSQIFNLLLLFNVETNRNSDSITEYYPFKQHKDNNWSLEHIHARENKINPTKKDVWLEWIDLHLPLLNEMIESEDKLDNNQKIIELINKIHKYNNQDLTWERFNVIFNEINEIFTLDHEGMDKDSEGVRNLALLSQKNNSALNDSVFEVKRREIINLDKEGSFIPICTKRVFMKYYHDNKFIHQFYFWSKEDRDSYYDKILDALDNYTTKNHIGEDIYEND